MPRVVQKVTAVCTIAKMNFIVAIVKVSLWNSWSNANKVITVAARSGAITFQLKAYICINNPKPLANNAKTSDVYHQILQRPFRAQSPHVCQCQSRNRL